MTDFSGVGRGVLSSISVGRLYETSLSMAVGLVKIGLGVTLSPPLLTMIFLNGGAMVEFYVRIILSCS